MKATLFSLCLILILVFLSINLSKAQSKVDFKPGKYARLVELDMSNMFRGYLGTNLIYRKKYENKNSQLVFADRIPYWRFGFYMGGYSTNIKFDTLNSTIRQSVRSSNNTDFYVAPFIGRETMFHWGRFNIFYAMDLGINYQYIDASNTTKNPCIANSFGLGVRVSGGLRYYINDRFSVSAQSTPLSIFGNYKIGKYYPYFNEIWSVPSVKFKEFSYSFSQNWLSMLGFAYHF